MVAATAWMRGYVRLALYRGVSAATPAGRACPEPCPLCRPTGLLVRSRRKSGQFVSLPRRYFRRNDRMDDRRLAFRLQHATVSLVEVSAQFYRATLCPLIEGTHKSTRRVNRCCRRSG